MNDLFGPVPKAAPKGKGKAVKPAPRMVAPASPAEPKVYEPIPMGRGGKPAAEQPREEPPMPRFKRTRLAALAPCDLCGRPSCCDEEFLIQRDFHRDEVVRPCKPCRASTGDDFPRAAWLAGALAGPWVVALLREANRLLPYEPRRGHL